MEVQNLLLELGKFRNRLAVELFEVVIHRVVFEMRPDVLSLLLADLGVQLTHAVGDILAKLLHLIVLIVVIFRQLLELFFEGITIRVNLLVMDSQYFLEVVDRWPVLNFGVQILIKYVEPGQQLFFLHA